MRRKILYITGTRADYGLMQSTLREIERDPSLELELAVTGMHLMETFGRTEKEVEGDGFKFHVLDAIYERDDRESMARFVGRLILLLTAMAQEQRPDVILLLGDRGEMLACAVVGAYLGIPVAHIHGGDVSSTVDDSVRHAISKLANIHFAATTRSRERLLKMGEEPWRIFVVGAPGLDSILKVAPADISEIEARYGFDSEKPILIVVQHPEISGMMPPREQIRHTLEAISDLELQTILIYPNADAGGREMIEVIQSYSSYPFLKIFPSLPRQDFLGMMKRASVLVGNSSSGMIEAPSLGLPVVNIGSRQQDRERGENVIDVDYDREQIETAIFKALYDQEFLAEVKKRRNPYGDGQAGSRIASLLSSIDIDSRLLQKRLSY